MTGQVPVRLEIVDDHGVQRDDEGWEHYSYTVRLTRGDESMEIPWRAGMALGDPTAVDVLEALLMDAATVENARDFEDWAAELGFDPDSRKAERIYNDVQKQTEELRQLLGDDYNDAVFPPAPDYDSHMAAVRLCSEDDDD